ncbi:histidine kinase [Modestobacter marinus]|uniref:histidine kinase n=1 Tax=Modestobacter marinus TaxID=477641 RepID=UPI001C97CA80|nr:histidine kinase [Modestobacter marinus]
MAAPLRVEDVAPFPDWQTAAHGALEFLHRIVGLDVWLVTHLEGEHQRVLDAHPRDQVLVGAVVPWDQSFCRKMVAGLGPRVATVTAAIPAYQGLVTPHPFSDRIAAYVGVPLVTHDLRVFGTLCGISARAQPRSLVRHLPTLEMTARLLSTLLPADSDLLPTVAGR